MTVSYGSLIATVKYGSFFRLLFRWRGSLYKLVWPGLLVYCFFYAAVAIAYHSIPDKPEYRNARLLFVQICYIAGRVTNAVPLSFVLAFYVNLVVSRWLQQFLCLPTPDAICLLLSAYLENGEERALVFRRTISRYINLASALCFCSISIGMKQRFPTLDSLVICGLMTEQELEIYSNLEESTSNFFVPLVWAISLITKAHEENMIREERHVDALVGQVVEFWEKLYKLCMYDWVNVPLVYNQVVALAVYIYFAVTIFGHQFIDAPSILPHIVLPNIPVFTILSFIFYNGWLKVAESLVSPFGLDDDDFEVVPLLERNLNTSLYFVDTCISDPNLIPELVKSGCKVDIETDDDDHTDGTAVSDSDYYSRLNIPGSRQRKISTKSKGGGSRRGSFLSPNSYDENYLSTPHTFESPMDNETPWPELPPTRQRRPSHTAFIGSLEVAGATKEGNLKLSPSLHSLTPDQQSPHLHPDTLITSIGSSLHRLGSKIRKLSLSRSNTPVIHELTNLNTESPDRSVSVVSSQDKLNSKDA
ncbi:bestrophin-related [Schistosoma mansoni]|uniref:bestrophin-related n=1 Tax=Schistosoma mansoni TaxID=6183 RepID=UPI0001A64647|nr:bestrophin-related [Schistosoma mansoni]|eukprot:XP_018653920.1 bestrophin-related [Schistosoma mansoni]